jgi:hypothetical protein
MKTMKTFVPFNQNLLKSVLFIFISASAVISNAQSSAGLQGDNSLIKNSSVVNADKQPASSSLNKLASFSAVISNSGKVDLKWTTEIETNLSHIMVERSTDGKNFKDAALVFTYGTTTARSDYAFADNISKMKSANIYYRLRIVDANGTTQYSDIRIIEINKDLIQG